MNISFNISFHTVWGQALFIIGSIPELGQWDMAQAKEMRYTQDGNWNLNLEMPDKAIAFEYRYFMKSNNQLIFEEWDKNHHLSAIDVQQTYFLVDYWLTRPQNLAFYSSAFTQSWFAHPCDKFERVVKSKRKLILKVWAPLIRENESLALLGNQKEMGNWEVANALILACDNYPEWYVELNAENLNYPIEYKFFIINNQDKSIVRWEKGENRSLNIPYLKENVTGIVSGLQFRDEQPQWKCAGVSIPVFSLRSKTSFGIGDFNDLYKMIDWVKATGQRIIQLLPINDTTMSHTRMDSYPYNSISIFAFHPLYISTDSLGVLDDPERADFYKRKQKELNALSLINYDDVDYWKWNFFREIYLQEKSKVLTSQEFILFFEENKEWLIPYAAYSYLRDKYHTPVFYDWKEYSVYNQAEIEKLCDSASPVFNEVSFYYYLQFNAHIQLKKVCSYAHQSGVVLKGDIPIGISRVSVEAWTQPHYFNMVFQAGAPPDDFAETGQNWGFPTYNWDVMESDNYQWWKKRLSKMAEYFSAYRIDHILGFFRIWQIPAHSIEGLLGYFNPAIPLSIDEIENGGLVFRKEQFTQANIHEKYLENLFGEYLSEVKQVYLDKTDSEHFSLKEPFNTQRKIQGYFSTREDEKGLLIKKALMNICNEVLFIEDDKQENHYHPRISASSSLLYKELSIGDKYAFDYIYWNYFYQRHNEFWKKEALKHLVPIINSTRMLVCGEDLGMIPYSVPEVMEKLQILSLEIERMPKLPGVEFTNLDDIPYLSVCTTSTHDMSTIRGWWEEDKGKTQRYFNEILNKEGQAPEIASPEICEIILRNHLESNSMLAIIPFQDWMSMDEQWRNSDIQVERINIPSDSRHYWRYRMHINIEDLLIADTLNEKMKELIKKSKRS